MAATITLCGMYLYRIILNDLRLRLMNAFFLFCDPPGAWISLDRFSLFNVGISTSIGGRFLGLAFFMSGWRAAE